MNNYNISNSYLIRYSPEIVLKGKNRSFFENTLFRNIENKFPKNSIFLKKEHKRFFLETNLPSSEVVSKLSCVFGISSFSPVFRTDLSLENIIRKACEIVAELEEAELSFAIEAQRSNKNFPLESPEINRKVGEALLDKFPKLSVKLKNPELTIGIEVRDDAAYLFHERIYGFGGLPVGSHAKMVSLLSGGLDSPVASWFMMRRGSPVVFATFHSPPFLDEEAYGKIFSLAKRLSVFQSETRIYKVFFTDIQKAIKVNCHDRYRTILYRRMMHRIASKIAEKEKALALITGESLGQVASQTLENLLCISHATELPVMRPLIGFDKEEIIERARKIKTFEISIQPYDDCCVLFAPKHPVTQVKLENILQEEQKLEVETLMWNALEKTQVIDIP